ncbi:MAG TPA: amidohydrolase family protein [Microbacteriaceae bacterium]|nr:amidohydrolase family protein [Microbacteriaceae bacterium]
MNLIDRKQSIAFIGGRVHTNTSIEIMATAVLIEDGYISAVGHDAEISAQASKAGINIQDLQGAVVTPGLYDSHAHPHWAVKLTSGIDLGGIKTLEELREVLSIEESKLGDGEWLIGWNLEFAVFDGLEIHADLIEESVAGRPTAIMFYDLHTGFGTRAALEAAGIIEPRKFSDRSEIVMGKDGMPTGELSEPSAYNLLFEAAPSRDRNEEREKLKQMFSRFAEVGLTGCAIMDGKPETISLVAELEEREELDLRLTIHQWHAVGDDDATVGLRIAEKDNHGKLWRADAIKLFSDGVIDTGTALLHTPDSCGHSTKGFWLDWRRFKEVVQKYHDAGMLVATHAVGDAAVFEVAKVYKSLTDRPGLPFHSIEHLEVLTDADIEQLRDTKITASMQPLHMQWRSADNDDSWSSRLGPKRWNNGYRVRDILDAGIRLVLGSDWPVAQYDPRIGMAWARGRKAPGLSAAPVFEAAQQLSGREALLAYTLWPAQARGNDNQGKIEAGCVGDLTVWASDPVTASPDELINIPILMTILGGRITHELKNFN